MIDTSRPALLAAACLLALSACSAQDSDADAASPLPADTTEDNADRTATQPEPAPSGAPVEQGPPNAPGQTPAFEGQTRAPAISSGMSLSANRLAAFDEPWGMARLPDGAWLVTEREGDLHLVSPDGERSEPLAGVPEVDNRDQGGLLDIATGPDFDSDNMVYFTFSEPRGDGTNGTSLARGRLSADRTALEEVDIIFRQKPDWESTKHFGSNIAFAPDGTLYLTLGERSLPEPRRLAQDLGTHLGKVIRLNPDGSVPDDNPFAGQTPDTVDGPVMTAIWSYGHRNMQGAAIHPETGRLWTIEHGPRGGDEINVPEAGGNYGWPVITYGIDYDGSPIGEGITSQEGMEQPVYYWDPVIAPGDMIFYEGAAIPQWQGDLLIASLKPGAIVRLELDGERVTGEERLLSDLGRIRDIDTDAKGNLYVLTDEDDGGFYRVVVHAQE